MPRIKQGPRRLGEEEQKSGNFVMGGDAENNEERNRELTQMLASAPACEVASIVQSVASEHQGPEAGQAEGSLYSVPVTSSQSKLYSVIFDDDGEDSYHSSEDEDFNPDAEAKSKKKSPKKPPKKEVSNTSEETDSQLVDAELKALIEDAEVTTTDMNESCILYIFLRTPPTPYKKSKI